MSSDTTKNLINRLRSIEGHVRSLERMLEQDAYCVDILHQSRAVQRALATFDQQILQRHLNTCVTTAIRSEDPEERERVIGELLQVFQSGARLSSENTEANSSDA